MVKDWKKNAVSDLAKDMSKYKSIMITDLTSLPSRELQQLRYVLKKSVKIFVAKKSIIKRSLQKLKMKEMADNVEGIPAVMLSNINPFELSVLIDKEKVDSFIKPGQEAEIDIIIPSGPTSFVPGPILTEFADVGLKTKIEGGKIKILKEKKVAVKGDIVDEKTASILRKMNIMPAKIGINIALAFEDGNIFKNIRVDVNEYSINFEKGYGEAMNLAYNSGILNDETIKLLIGKAHSEAFSLALNAKIYTEETLPIILAEANIHASSLMGV